MANLLKSKNWQLSDNFSIKSALGKTQTCQGLFFTKIIIAMKYQLIVHIFLLLQSSHLIGQNEFNYFNRLMNPDSASILTNCALAIEDGYLTVGVLGSTSNYTAIYLSKIDLEGNFQWIKILDEDSQVATMASGSSFIQDTKNPNHFLAMYGKYQNSNNTDLGVALIKFDGEGNIIWERLHGDQKRQAPYTLINTNDGGYLISGWEQISSNPTQGYMLKLDSLGNEQWHKNHTLSEEGHSNLGFAQQTMDGGYVLSSYGYLPGRKIDMYIVKVDDLGNLEWEQNYGSTEEDWGCQILELSEGGYFVSGAKYRFGDTQNYFAKLNELGEIIWDKDIYIRDGGSALLQKTSNGDFIGFGGFRENNIPRQPMLIRITSRGDTLWTKPITPDPSNEVYIRDMEATPDGGYIIAGFNYTHTPQYGWIAKIDSLGNTCWSSLDCDSTAIITSIPQLPSQNPYQVKISPNPVRDRVTVSYQLPLDGRLQLYDLQGRWIREWWLPAVVESMPLEVGDLEGGLYLYKVNIEGREISSGKLVVE